MTTCVACNSENGNNAKFCMKCGSPLAATNTSTPTARLDATIPRRSKLAIWSLIFGILGIILFAIPCIPAIVVGHMARHRIRTSNGTLAGNGISLAGLILGYGVLASALLFLSINILVPAYHDRKMKEATLKDQDVRALDPRASGGDKYAELTKLRTLLESGTISKDEFDEQKKRLLAR